jgi:hypothetical protein
MDIVLSEQQHRTLLQYAALLSGELYQRYFALALGQLAGHPVDDATVRAVAQAARTTVVMQACRPIESLITDRR